MGVELTVYRVPLPASTLKIRLIKAGKESTENKKIYKSSQGINRITVSEIPTHR
jgi:hypothetical protein